MASDVLGGRMHCIGHEKAQRDTKIFLRFFVPFCGNSILQLNGQYESASAIICVICGFRLEG
jgi:hypothetical protein